MFQLLGSHFCSLVEQDDVTELDLLDHQCLEVFLFRHIVRQSIAPIELIPQTQRVHHSADTVQHRQPVLGKLRHHLRVTAERLRDRCRFANSRSLDDDVVIGFLCGEVV